MQEFCALLKTEEMPRLKQTAKMGIGMMSSTSDSKRTRLPELADRAPADPEPPATEGNVTPKAQAMSLVCAHISQPTPSKAATIPGVTPQTLIASFN